MGSQLLNDLIDTQLTFRTGFQTHEYKPGISRYRHPSRAGGRHDVLYAGLFGDDLGNFLLMLHHGLEGGSLSRFGEAKYLRNILTGDEVFGNDPEEIDSCRQEHKKHGYGQRTMPQGPFQASVIG